MNISQYASKVDLLEKSETAKVAYLSYFYFKRSDKKEIFIDEILLWFDDFHFSKPNVSRLKKNLARSSLFVCGSRVDTYKLHARAIQKLSQEIPELSERSEEITSSGSILPNTLLAGTRGYIVSLGEQINACYEQNISDGCAVLMRRLIEVLLIQTYQHLKIQEKIQSAPDQFKDLKLIIADAISNKDLNLSKGTKDVLDEFRVIGNFSAHKIIYNCRKEEISRVSKEYRAAVEELIYKSGLKA